MPGFARHRTPMPLHNHYLLCLQQHETHYLLCSDCGAKRHNPSTIIEKYHSAEG
jgi:hypothetical protein